MDELIQVIKILDYDQVEKINKYADTLEFKPSRIFSRGDERHRIDTGIRSSTGAFLNDDAPETIMLTEAINTALLEYKRRCANVHPNFSYYPMPGGINTSSRREALQILNYTEGQHYKFHHDASANGAVKEYHRKISVIIYLKNAIKGGGTIFPHTLFKPSVGYGLIFPSNWCYPHAGMPVIEGNKRVAVTWYYTLSNNHG
tara:strand:+ start:36 stop:638 length:603 start_codon:yes stop_codon:yes gene_type:complete